MFKNTINIFIEVVEQGSFSAAAKKLFMTQSAVSQQINHLEKELGYQLFNRKEYRPKLTEAGKLYYQLCRNIIQDYNKREKQIREIAMNTSSKIQLAITGNFEQQYFPDMLKSFISNNHVKVGTRQSTFQEGVEWLLDGKVDLAFGLMNEFIRYPELESYQVLASHICFVCSEDHPLSGYDTVSIRELSDEPIVVLSTKMGKYYYEDFMEAFRKDGFLPNIVKEVDNMGRIIRQGNQNKEVQVYQYVTEGTFDAYLYQTLENKQKFISQIMTSKSPVRSCDDVDEQALSYAEIKALCAGNPMIKEKMDLDIDMAKLKVLKADHQSKVYRLEDQLLKYFPAEIEKYQSFIKGFEKDIEVVEQHPLTKEDFVGITVGTKYFTDKELAGEAILATCKSLKGTEPVNIGEYRGFKMELDYDSFNQEYQLTLKGNMSHRLTLGTDPRGNLIRMDNALSCIPNRLEKSKTQLDNLYNQQEAAKVEVKKPFPLESELSQKSARLAELDAALNMDEPSEVKQEKEKRPSVLAELKRHSDGIPHGKNKSDMEVAL